MSGKATAYVAVSATGNTAAYGVWVVRSKGGRRYTICRGHRCPPEVKDSQRAMTYAMNDALRQIRKRWPDVVHVEYVSHNSNALERLGYTPVGVRLTSRRTHSRRGYIRWCERKARGIIHGWDTGGKPQPDIADTLGE